jgi:hypothetical protein
LHSCATESSVVFEVHRKMTARLPIGNLAPGHWFKDAV